MAVNQNAIDRLHLDEAFTEKMLHRAFNECWTVKCDELLLVVDDDETKNFPIAHSTIQDYVLEFMQDNNGMNVVFSSETCWEEPDK